MITEETTEQPKQTEDESKKKEIEIASDERAEFIKHMAEVRDGINKREYSKSYDILLAVMLRLEELGMNFDVNIKIDDPDIPVPYKVNLRRRFYDLMRGDIVDDPMIRAAYKKGASPYANHVWNLMALEQLGDPEMLDPDPESGSVIKVVHIRSGDVINYSDWYKVWNHLIRQLDLVVPRLERMILNALSPQGMSL